MSLGKKEHGGRERLNLSSDSGHPFAIRKDRHVGSISTCWTNSSTVIRKILVPYYFKSRLCKHSP